MAKANNDGHWNRSHEQSVPKPFLAAASGSNKHHQRPADRSRGVPQHLSAPRRLAASLRCANGCVSGRRV